ncbi:hypothetical protein ACOBQJ_07865 [Pelotomaculum propionicicum]|uniref:hypothetical protein n=1 Tax=Pelotomaculum propionicicum TaxID=258475 RepID=UPI003B7B24B1
MRNWSGFLAGTDEAIVPLPDVMRIVSTPRHSARLNGKYVSSAPGYGPLFFENLKKVTNNASFWDPKAI